jgi:YesN/AraC family two-component response regulator
MQTETPEKMKDLKILLVNDDKGIRVNFGKFLSRFCKEVITAQNGKEGLDLYQNHQPDLIITDVVMLKLDGTRMVAKIKEVEPDVKVIFITDRDMSSGNINC